MTEFEGDKKNLKIDSQINLSRVFVVNIVHKADKQLTYIAPIRFILSCKN